MSLSGFADSNRITLFIFYAFLIDWNNSIIIKTFYYLTVKHNGNVTLEEIINIGRTMRGRSMARTLAGTVKEILGSAQVFSCSLFVLSFNFLYFLNLNV